MNGLTLSGDSGVNRRWPVAPDVSTHGGGGRLAAHSAAPFAASPAADSAGSSIVPQTTRRGPPISRS